MKKQPDAEAFQKMASRLKENSRQWDTLNFQLDELIAQVEADIRSSSLTQYRLTKHSK
ncbi:hypothetical protein [Aphanothece sacrum]|uniref:Uncharacterized protein n=1 Tax=Aphanothece sacrum FPU1 TaxID=1920663 RepID=A0A401IE04_APHSA|nr:hypothetical protein [Aphanothece sacrum]GBF79512.1 hypothetical protein AsFPU1_0908 [Aphanothece sacrum FPU1]GBF83947.1 hypothetical protein AsFPU3_0991 [Aphanothece sacrum FPU3]